MADDACQVIGHPHSELFVTASILLAQAVNVAMLPGPVRETVPST